MESVSMISRCSEAPHLRQIAACRISKAPRTPRLDPCQGVAVIGSRWARPGVLDAAAVSDRNR